MDMGLKNKVALISGGSIGIGLAVARALAAEGVHLALLARQSERLEKVASEIRAEFGVRAIGLQADVSKAGEAEARTADAIKELGGVDILVSNAGAGTAETIMDAPDGKWQHYWDLHVMASVRLARAVVPSMKKRGGGVILNTASICANQPLGYEPIYNVTKAALAMFTKCLANELIADNIRVNSVNPGLILTPDWRKTATLLGKKEGITADQYLDRIAKENAPIGRFASPEELANFYIFLCSPRASYCVGSTYYVDGGWLKVVK